MKAIRNAFRRNSKTDTNNEERTRSDSPSPSPPTANSFSTGLKTFSEPTQPNEGIVDIIFVHGITGSREGTWTAKNATTPWPKAFLPSTLPVARILSFGYDARVVDWRDIVSKGRVADHARKLLHSVANLRVGDDTSNRPIIFVVHSLGGLVCEDALLLSNGAVDAHLKAVLDHTVAIAFMGTPHAGARALADWAGGLAKAVGIFRDVNKELLAVLETDSEVLARIQQEFHTMIRARQTKGSPEIKITCFYEQLTINRAIGFVVHPQSAILPSYNCIPLDKNHITMTKFAVDKDPDYISVLEELRRWYRGLATNGSEHQAETGLIDVETVAMTQRNARARQVRKPRNTKELAAIQCAAQLQLTFDADIDEFLISIPKRLLPGDDVSNFTLASPASVEKINEQSQWQRILHQFDEKSTSNDDRRQQVPLPLVPWKDGSFLALIRSSEIFRILASRVSERQKGDRVVLVHNIKFTISNKMYQQTPIVYALYYKDSGHYLPHTICPSRAYADAFAGAGSMEPRLPYNFTFICSEPGYQRVQMPYLLAMYEIPREFNVLFCSQINKCLSLWELAANMLDQAWDHDDAFECSPDQTPIKIRVESYRALTLSQRPSRNENFDLHSLETSVLRKECQRYFEEHTGHSFENEDLVRLLRNMEAALDPDFESERVGLVEEWYTLYGFETARWLLLAITITLGYNFSGTQALPESFEILRQNPNCYIS